MEWRTGLVAVGIGALLAGGWARAQSRWVPVAEPQILTGPDVGFRVEWLHGRTPVGQLVVRMNGTWVDARVGEPGDRQVVPPPPTPPPAPAR